MWFAKWFFRDRWNFFDLVWLEIGFRTFQMGHAWRALLIMLIGSIISGIIARALGPK